VKALKIVKCENCGCDVEIFHKKRLNAKHNFCSHKCFGDWQKKQNLNCTCPVCGKKFRVKPSALAKRKLKACCSMECNKKYRSIYMAGAGNHQFGLKGDKNASFKGSEIMRKNSRQMDVMVYCPEHPYASPNGRVKKHRRVVELNAEKYDPKYFELISGNRYLKPEYRVHHIDGNHANNSVDNLQVLTPSEHMKIHHVLRRTSKKLKIKEAK
jgi:hypothetical protein